jgi:hypothetical protein
MSIHTLHFFLPESDEVLASIPSRTEDYWQWQKYSASILPYWGRYHWVVQTYLYLKQAGLPAILTNSIPGEGIILTHMDCVDYGFRPTSSQFLVVMLVDRLFPHPWADLHVLHNPTQRLHLGMDFAYMPPWPQIGIISRNATRGESFETIGYFGYPENLHSSIIEASFLSGIEKMGLRIFSPSPAEWHDFSEVDCIMAIRSLGQRDKHRNKPSLKLFNAWLAGVPAILGHESAYRAEGSPGKGYLEAKSSAELLQSLMLLSEDANLRKSIVTHGQLAVQAFKPEATVQRWRQFIQRNIVPRFDDKRARGNRISRQKMLGILRERINWRFPGWF